jgi:hypothetical protein
VCKATAVWKLHLHTHERVVTSPIFQDVCRVYWSQAACPLISYRLSTEADALRNDCCSYGHNSQLRNSGQTSQSRCSWSGAETVLIRLGLRNRFGRLYDSRDVPIPDISSSKRLHRCLLLLRAFAYTHICTSFVRPEVAAATTSYPIASIKQLWPDERCILHGGHATRDTRDVASFVASYVAAWVEVRRGPDLTCVCDAFVTSYCNR